ncbi:MAG: ABC transporter ATP-binding protein [Burkholderiaceae bacterium]
MGDRHDDAQVAPLMLLEDVCFAWSEGPPLLDIRRFDIGAGESVFLAGPSGAGKSSLLSLIGGVVLPSTGRILLRGHDLTRLSGVARDRLRADELGIVFQQFNLVPYLSIEDNVLLPCRFSPARRARIAASGSTPVAEARRLLDALGLGARGLQGRAVSGLSIGQQQRVAVARALIGSPSLIIADEPTSALDEDMRERFMRLLFDQCRASAAALLFVSHDVRLAARFDRRLNLAGINRAADAALQDAS